MEYSEDDYLMLSGIQHFMFCSRQWALIHIEQQWAENEETVLGQLLHQKADNPYIKEKRSDTIISRAVPVSSKILGLSGILDILELHKNPSGIRIKGRKGYWIPNIVEYKRGVPKNEKYDIVQLAAQVLCLEETFQCHISSASLYYFGNNKKIDIEITDELKAQVVELSREMHRLFTEQKLPKAELYRNCKRCSLYDICKPHLSKKSKNIERYMSNAMLGD